MSIDARDARGGGMTHAAALPDDSGHRHGWRIRVVQSFVRRGLLLSGAHLLLLVCRSISRSPTCCRARCVVSALQVATSGGLTPSRSGGSFLAVAAPAVLVGRVTALCSAPHGRSHVMSEPCCCSPGDAGWVRCGRGSPVFVRVTYVHCCWSGLVHGLSNLVVGSPSSWLLLPRRRIDPPAHRLCLRTRAASACGRVHHERPMWTFRLWPCYPFSPAERIYCSASGYSVAPTADLSGRPHRDDHEFPASYCGERVMSEEADGASPPILLM